MALCTFGLTEVCAAYAFLRIRSGLDAGTAPTTPPIRPDVRVLVVVRVSIRAVGSTRYVMSTCEDLVPHVLFVCAPPEIGEAVVQRATGTMETLHVVRTRTDEGLQH